MNRLISRSADSSWSALVIEQTNTYTCLIKCWSFENVVQSESERTGNHSRVILDKPHRTDEGRKTKMTRTFDSFSSWNGFRKMSHGQCRIRKGVAEGSYPEHCSLSLSRLLLQRGRIWWCIHPVLTLTWPRGRSGSDALRRYPWTLNWSNHISCRKEVGIFDALKHEHPERF